MEVPAGGERADQVQTGGPGGQHVLRQGAGLGVSTELESKMESIFSIRLALLRPNSETQREAVCLAIIELLWKVRSTG